MLDFLHRAHFKVLKTEMFLRFNVWWPKLDEEVEKMVKTCDICQINREAKNEQVFINWPETHKNWYRIHIDFFQFTDKHFLLFVDSKSKWLDLHIMNSTNLDSTIDKLNITFSTLGYPLELVSDNGPPLDSRGFKQFFKEKGINYINTLPYIP